jgi:hypothetical protein
MDPIDELLSKLQPQSEPQRQSEVPPSTPASGLIDKLLQDIDPTATPSKSMADESLLAQGATPKEPLQDSLLEEVRSQDEQQDQAEAERLEQETREKQRRLKQLKAQRRAELAEKALDWLKQLNPKSSEGRWFEEFACGYSSRVEAAIDYLEALSEVNPNLE